MKELYVNVNCLRERLYSSFQEAEILVFYLPRPQKSSNTPSAASYLPTIKCNTQSFCKYLSLLQLSDTGFDSEADQRKGH